MQQRTPVQMVTITEDNAGQRVDNFLMAQFRHVPKSRIYRMIRNGEVRVNRSRVRNNSRLAIGDLVRLPPVSLPEEESFTIHPNELREIENGIIAENEHFIILNKPSGYAVHKGSGNPYGIIDIVRQLRNEETFIELVQRLDRDTSGILLIAKSRPAHQALQECELKRFYQLLVHGQWPDSLTIITDPLKTDNRLNGERHVIVVNDGKEAETHFTIISRHTQATLLEAELITGRTHQIRVHAAFHRHPIIGDLRYGDPALNRRAKEQGLSRLFLHASELTFRLFDEDYQFKAPLPSMLDAYLKTV